jgi:hypothetical protein
VPDDGGQKDEDDEGREEKQNPKQDAQARPAHPAHQYIPGEQQPQAGKAAELGRGRTGWHRLPGFGQRLRPVLLFHRRSLPDGAAHHAPQAMPALGELLHLPVVERNLAVPAQDIGFGQGRKVGRPSRPACGHAQLELPRSGKGRARHTGCLGPAQHLGVQPAHGIGRVLRSQDAVAGDAHRLARRAVTLAK